MSTLLWVGNAQDVADVWTVTPANPQAGDIFKVTINGKTESYTALLGDEELDIVAGLVAALEASEIPEFQQFTYEDMTTYVKMTATEKGVPWTITASTTNDSSADVVVTTTREGNAGRNEIQQVRLSGAPSGGTFTLTFQGQTTGAMAYNISAANMQTALEALSNIAPGDVIVTRSGSGTLANPYLWLVEFDATYGNMDVDLMTGDGSSITGACSVTVTTSTGGTGGLTNEVQRVTLNVIDVADSGFSLSIDHPTLGSIGTIFSGSWFSTAADMELAMNLALAGYNGRVVVVAVSATATVKVFDVYFYDDFGGVALDEMAAIYNPGISVAVTEETAGGAAAGNEVQTVTLVGGPTGGTFTLTFSGQTTGNIAYNASAGTVTTALEALSNIGVGDVAITGSNPWVVTFQGALAGLDVPQMTGSGTNLTGCTVFALTTQTFTPLVNEVQTVTLTNSPTGGTFTLTYSGQTTGNIAYNAAASALVTALEALSNIGVGDVDITGADGGPWQVEFKTALAATDVAEMTGSGANLTGDNTQTLTAANSTVATGKNFADNTANYSTGALPVNGDTLIFQDTDIDCLYLLEALSSVTLAALYIYQSFEGRIGLPRYNENDYVEYRPRKLKVGATLIYIGDGDGAGSGRLNLDTGSVQTAILMNGSGQPLEDDLPAVHWIGTHASNAATINKGSFGAAVIEGEAATLATLNVGDDDSAVVTMGRGVTLAAVNGNGGVALIRCATTGSVVLVSGTLTFMGTGAVSQLNLRGDAVCVYNTSGTLGGNTEVSDSAVLDFSGDTRSKTVTNPIDCYGSATRVVDPNKVASGLILDWNGFGQGKELEIGRNVRITRGTPA